MRIIQPKHYFTGIFLLFVAIGIFPILSFAQTSSDSTSPTPSQANPAAPVDREAQKAELRKQLADIEQELQQLQGQINNQVQKKKDLQGAIKSLENKMYKVRLQIRQLDVSIRETQIEAQDTSEQIENFKTRIEEEKQDISSLLERISQTDELSTVELMLGYETFSQFFDFKLLK